MHHIRTIHDKLVWALEARGYHQVKARTGKYTVLTKPGFQTNSGKPAFYFVGVAGALRFGATATKSIPSAGRSKLLAEFEAASAAGTLHGPVIQLSPTR